MNKPWLIYVAVAAISALAGIAIAGLPNTVSTDATIIVPETTTTTTTAPEPEPAPTTDAPADTTTTTSTTTTEVRDTTTTTEPLPEIDRAELGVVVVNGASAGGLATRVRDELRDAGFERARPVDGTTIVDTTVVYFVEGFLAQAIDVAEELGLELGDVKPVEEAPSFDLGDDDVAVYLGRDSA